MEKTVTAETFNYPQSLPIIPKITKKEIQDMINTKLDSLFAQIPKLAEIKQKEYLTTKEVEAIYGIALSTLTEWRMYGKGPKYVQHAEGGKIFYKKSAIEEFFALNTIKTIDQN